MDAYAPSELSRLARLTEAAPRSAPITAWKKTIVRSWLGWTANVQTSGARILRRQELLTYSSRWSESLGPERFPNLKFILEEGNVGYAL